MRYTLTFLMGINCFLCGQGFAQLSPVIGVSIGSAVSLKTNDNFKDYAPSIDGVNSSSFCLLVGLQPKQGVLISGGLGLEFFSITFANTNLKLYKYFQSRRVVLPLSFKYTHIPQKGRVAPSLQAGVRLGYLLYGG